MFNRNDKNSPRIDTLIGRSARVQGDVEFSGGLHIDGQVTGSVRVVPGGAASVSVSVRGNVCYGVIEMALGAEITGRLIPANAAAAQTG